jgi:hypothetical protein
MVISTTPSLAAVGRVETNALHGRVNALGGRADPGNRTDASHLHVGILS